MTLKHCHEANLPIGEISAGSLKIFTRPHWILQLVHHHIITALLHGNSGLSRGCRCRASVQRGTRLQTFRVFAWTLVGLIWTDVVSIGLLYLILSVHTYSSQTCSTDTPQQRTTTISRLTPSVLTLSFPLLLCPLSFSLVLYGTRILQ